MASGLFSSERNFSLYTIPVAYILAVAPHALAITSTSKFDNRHPRNHLKAVEGDQSIDKATKERVLRLSSASENGLENIGLFAAAVVAGNVAGLANETLNRLSMSYVAARVLYTVLYANNTTPTTAWARSAVFWLGQGLLGSLFIRSGRAANSLRLPGRG